MIKSILYSLFLILAGLIPFNSTHSYTLNAYDFSFKDIDGNDLKLKDYKGKVLLVVNVASKCGFTGQYEGLQAIWDKYRDKDFVLVGIPSNDFYQEYSDEKDVKNFCELTFGVNFPMTSITSIRGKDAHPFYKWAKLTYGNKTVPKWNFHKILIDKNGKVVETYSSMTKPTDDKIVNLIEDLL
jgi:glutathione peroxidase|tara:strand:+ start:74 stop:622 length:549 start_codon:yes stop_codon:yes gene_type:complete